MALDLLMGLYNYFREGSTGKVGIGDCNKKMLSACHGIIGVQPPNNLPMEWIYMCIYIYIHMYIYIYIYIYIHILMVYCIIGICKNIARIQPTNDEHGVFQNMIKVDLQHIMKSQMGLEANLNQRSLFFGSHRPGDAEIRWILQDKTYEQYTVHGSADHSTQLNVNGGVFKWETKVRQCVARRKKVSGTKTKISPEVVETIHRALQAMIVKW